MRKSLLKKIAIWVEKKQGSIFTYSVQKQKKYLASLPEPKDNYERSYYQYCCQMKLYGEPLHFLINLAALPMWIIYLNKKTDVVKQKEVYDAVFFNDGKPANIIPMSLRVRFHKIQEKPLYTTYLSQEDKKFLKQVLRRYPTSWLFLLKIIFKVSQYSGAIEEYQPKAIISCGEFSYTSSILTEYCHHKGVKLINVMHGEKLFHMRDSFVNFDEYYVWDKCYADLLISLRCNKNQFRIEVPKSLCIKIPVEVEKKYDYTYYLASESEKVLNLISEKLIILKNRGKRISVRPHPRYSNIEHIKKIFAELNIEDTSKITIEQSLAQTDRAIALYSTVLNQAYHSGIKIIIDDLSNVENYRKLKELQYGMLQVEHSLLSKEFEM